MVHSTDSAYITNKYISAERPAIAVIERDDDECAAAFTTGKNPGGFDGALSATFVDVDTVSTLSILL
jgi:hypothetical protein